MQITWALLAQVLRYFWVFCQTNRSSSYSRASQFLLHIPFEDVSDNYFNYWWNCRLISWIESLALHKKWYRLLPEAKIASSNWLLTQAMIKIMKYLLLLPENHQHLNLRKCNQRVSWIIIQPTVLCWTCLMSCCEDEHYKTVLCYNKLWLSFKCQISTYFHHQRRRHKSDKNLHGHKI